MKIDEIVRMQKSYREGVAHHSGPESCVGDRKVVDEALTGEHSGWPLSREILIKNRGADVLLICGRQHRSGRNREPRPILARSKTPCMSGTISYGNREILHLSAEEGAADRIGKSKDARR